MSLWGKFSDKFGNRELLKIGAMLTSLVPILWIFSPSPIFIILIPQLISGIGWAAFNLSASNFIYDSVSPQRRGICVAYYNILVGVGIFIGGITGGLLAQYLPSETIKKFLIIFAISGILRFIASLIFLPRIKEVKKVKKISENPIAYIQEIKPLTGVAHQLLDGIRDVHKGIKKIIKSKI
jgi:MFS family permease